MVNRHHRSSIGPSSIGVIQVGVVVVGVLCGLLMPGHADAGFPSTEVRLIANDGSRPSAEVSTEASDMEKVVLQLVRAHLPELAQVLKQLKKMEPRHYELAIKELFKSARRLESARERDPALFQIEVELLQAQQQATLLIARLKVRDSQADRKQLRDVAKRLQQAQLARAEYDVDLFRQRVARSQQQLDAAISRLESRNHEAEEQLEKSLQAMLRKSGRDSKRNDSGISPRASKDGDPNKPSKSPLSEPPRE